MTDRPPPTADAPEQPDGTGDATVPTIAPGTRVTPRGARPATPRNEARGGGAPPPPARRPRPPPR